MPAKIVDKTTCRTPTLGKKPTRIDTWKFDAVRKAILKILPKRGEGVEFMKLPALVKKQLSQKELKELGSVGWFTTTVKLELEVRSETYRVEGVSPQRLLKA